MKLLPATRDQNGFSILEVVIASAMLSLLTYAFLAQTSIQQKTMNAWDSKLEANDVKTSVAILLSNVEACSGTFNNTTQTANVTVINRAEKNSGGIWTLSPVYRTGTATTNLINNTLYLESIKLENDSTGAVPANNMGKLRIALNMVYTKNVTGPSRVTRYVTIKIQTDGAGRVARCNAVTGEEQKQIFCQNPTLECTNSLDFCLGEAYANLAADCLCNGAKSSGANINGMPCGPSPTPPPSGVPLPACSSLASTCPTGNSYYFELQFDRNLYCSPTGIGMTNPCNGPTAAVCEVASTGKTLTRICGSGPPGSSDAPWVTCVNANSGGTAFYKNCTN
jgi:type II secretory pathway pseudopilin PulG